MLSLPRRATRFSMREAGCIRFLATKDVVSETVSETAVPIFTRPAPPPKRGLPIGSTGNPAGREGAGAAAGAGAGAWAGAGAGAGGFDARLRLLARPSLRNEILLFFDVAVAAAVVFSGPTLSESTGLLLCKEVVV